MLSEHFTWDPRMLCKKLSCGVPWWVSRLRIQHCHCCGMGSVPGLGTSVGHGCSKKKKERKRKKETKKPSCVQDRICCEASGGNN